MTRSMNIASAVLVAVSFCPGARSTERPIDVANNSVRIHVRKAGLFSAKGHEHWVTAPFDQGSVERRAFSCNFHFLCAQVDGRTR
jgi:hypothetical protein